MTRTDRTGSNGLFRAALVVTAIAAVTAGMAMAQSGQNNQPYSFGGNGLGMSTAGKQAILADQLLGYRPENMLVGPGGALLLVSPAPSGSAIVYDWSGTAVPGYRGRGWRSDLFIMRPVSQMLFVDGYSGAGGLTSVALGDWTRMVGGDEALFAGYLLPSGLNTLDLWVWEMYVLSPP